MRLRILMKNKEEHPEEGAEGEPEVGREREAPETNRQVLALHQGSSFSLGPLSKHTALICFIFSCGEWGWELRDIRTAI